MSKKPTFQTRIDIPAEARVKLIELLNQHLADTTDLYFQTKQAHWNVKGEQFIALHKLFDEFAEQLQETVDDIAERVTALGGYAFGTVRTVAKQSRLPEYNLEAVSGVQHLTALADHFAVLSKSTRSAIETATELGDADTADLFTGISRDLDKNLWFIEAHLQK